MAAIVAAKRLSILDQHIITLDCVIESAALLAHFGPVPPSSKELLHVVLVDLDEVVSVNADAANVREVELDLLGAGCVPNAKSLMCSLSS